MSDFIDGIEVGDDGRFTLHYTDEASVRRGLARLARAAGWFEVREEVAIPGWGTIDLLLRPTPRYAPTLIELKLDLTRPAAVRKAFQQIDGYSRGWTAEHGEQSTPVLSACKQDIDTVDRIALAYPQVSYKPMANVINYLVSAPGALTARYGLAAERANALRAEMDLHSAVADAVARLAFVDFRTDATATAVQTFVDAGLVQPDAVHEVDQ